MKRHAPTNVDTSTARRSAREAWLASTLHLFEQAVDARNSAPAHALQLSRMVLEGWAHLVCIELDPEFATHARGELNREPLAKVLATAQQHVDPGHRAAIRSLKSLGDQFHHNQGEPPSATVRTAHAALLHCADLLELLYRDVLRADTPPGLGCALSKLQAPRDRSPAIPAPPPASRARAASLSKAWILGGVGVVALVGLTGVLASRWGAGESRGSKSSSRGPAPATEQPSRTGRSSSFDTSAAVTMEESAASRGPREVVVVSLCGYDVAPLRSATSFENRDLKQTLASGTVLTVGDWLETPVRPGKRSPDRWYRVQAVDGQPVVGWIHVDAIQSIAGQNEPRVPCYRCPPTHALCLARCLEASPPAEGCSGAGRSGAK